ncbi:hypothetical protein LXL04_037403 [Taraxacum kok-saghyz]
MMGIKRFVVVFFGLLICNLVCGTKLVREVKTSLADGDGTKIGDIGVHYVGNNGESTDGLNKNIGGRKCMNGGAGCGDIDGKKNTRRNNNIITGNASDNTMGINENSHNSVNENRTSMQNGQRNQNGNNTINGPASVNAINSVVGDESGNVNNAVNVKGKVPPRS